MAGDYFILRSIADEMLSYHPVLPCRLESAIIPMSDFVKGQLPVDPYTLLKLWLLAAHQLTDYHAGGGVDFPGADFPIAPLKGLRSH